MNRINQILLTTALLCLVLWYAYHSLFLQISAHDFSIKTSEDRPVAIDFFKSNPRKERLGIQIVKYPTKGTIQVDGALYRYFPDQHFQGDDQFLFKLVKGNRESEPAKVDITVTSVNDVPIVKSQEVGLKEDSTISFELFGLDYDNDHLSFVINRYPKNGEISGYPPKLFYQPNPDFYGSDKLVYYVKDGKFRSETADVVFSVKPVNDVPVSKSTTVQLFQNAATVIPFEAWDKEGESLKFEVTDLPGHGHIKKQLGNVIYIPAKNFIGDDLLRFVAKDGHGASPPAEIRLTVIPNKKNKNLSSVLDSYLGHGGVAIGQYSNPEHLLHSGKYIPASVLKIITASAVIHKLGREYRFKTDISVSSNNSLVIKGYGDPTLTSEVWHEIARKLQMQGVFENDLHKLVLDTSAFSNDLVVHGRRASLNYYDSPPSTLATNGNTVIIKIGGNRRISVRDELTPLTPMIVKKSRGLPAGIQRFNVANDSLESIKYSKEVIQSIFEQYGAFFEDGAEIKQLKGPHKLICRHLSEQSLKDVVKKMLLESNNYIANQLLLTLAYNEYGEGVTITDGVAVLSGFLKSEIKLDTGDFSIVEGSGLSNQNHIDLLAMLKVLNYFTDLKELLPPLSLSKYRGLARAGRKWKILAKSGTLKNVSTLAGYLLVENKEWKPFVIMLNESNAPRSKVLELIAKHYNG